MKKRILIIGCGSIGQRHIRAIKQIDNYPIAALRTYKGSIKKLPEDIASSIITFDTIESAFAWNPSHIIISNPTALHLDFLKIAIQHRCKIFIEKPVTANYDDFSNNDISTNQLLQQQIQVGYNLRFHSLFQKIKELIETNIYGSVFSASLFVGHYLPFWHPYEDYSQSYAAKKELGGGVLRTLSHEIDLSQFFFGKIKKLYAKVEKISNLNIDTDDCVDIIALTDKCKRLMIHTDYLQPKIKRYGSILFEKGLLEYDFIISEICFTDYKTKETEILFNTKEDYNKQYIAQMKAFITNDKNNYCTIAHEIENLKIIKASEQSSKKGTEIWID